MVFEAESQRSCGLMHSASGEGLWQVEGGSEEETSWPDRKPERVGGRVCVCVRFIYLKDRMTEIEGDVERQREKLHIGWFTL